MRLHHDFIWSMLVHIGTNLWYEEGNARCDCSTLYHTPATPYLRFDRAIYDEHINDIVANGLNAVVIDLADAMIFDSHPELAIEGSFTKEEMRQELDRLNSLGLEVIPKLNFSATHDTWLKQYSRMLSTDIYYKVCSDLIDEVCELFEPRYFHIGFDEEGIEHQAKYDYVVIRNNDLWWHDLKFLASCVEKHGARALVWSDYARNRPDEFVEKLPKSVIPVNWYYFTDYGEDMEEWKRIRVAPFNIFEAHGFDQIPGGSVEYHKENMELLAKYCKEHISPEHLLGFIQTTWVSLEPKYKEQLHVAAVTTGEAKAVYEKTAAKGTV